MAYNDYDRSPDYDRYRPGGRDSGRDRDDYRSDNSYRERRRSPDRHRERDRRRSRSPASMTRQPERDREDSRRPLSPRRHGRRSSLERVPIRSNVDRYVPPPVPTQALLVNPLIDPLKLDTQVGFSWFSEWWKTEQHIKKEKERIKNGLPQPRLKSERELREEREAQRPIIQAAYDQYKEDLQKTQAQAFCRSYKDEDWFRERYVPEAREPFRAKLMEYRKTLYTAFMNDLENGEFDKFTLEGVYKTDVSATAGALEEGETTATNDLLQTGDLLPVAGGDMRDPMSKQPTLLIKTVAPTVSRDKIEAFAKAQLGTEVGGFRHLSLSDPNVQRKRHRMGWIILNDLAEVDEQGSMDEGEIEMDEFRKTASSCEQVLKLIDGKSIDDTDRGNFTLHCSVHRPPDAPRKKALWDLFSAPERIARDLELATRLVRKLDNELGDEYFGGAKIEERVSQLAERGDLTAQSNTKQEKDMDIDEEEGMIEEESDDDDLLVRKKKLDLLVEYLRRVYNFCFFCVFESDSVHELQRKCAGGHLRRPRTTLSNAAREAARASASGEAFPLNRDGTIKDPGKGEDEDGMDVMEAESPEESKFAKNGGRSAQQLQRAFSWVKTYEEKLLQILEPEQVQLSKIGGMPVQEGIDEELNKLVSREDQNKFRCKVPECSKLFKGLEFWRKHVKSRHKELEAGIQQEVELVNTYVMDPARIAPSRSDASSNGHFPIANTGVATGTPRNFSLQSHMPTGFASWPPMVPQGYPPLGPPPGFPPVMGMGTGPIRSQARPGNGYRAPAPYSRDGRAGRGSMSSRPGAPMNGGGIGPREATTGRTMRSYEDLDAAGSGSKTTELDY